MRSRIAENLAVPAVVASDFAELQSAAELNAFALQVRPFVSVLPFLACILQEIFIRLF